MLKSSPLFVSRNSVIKVTIIYDEFSSAAKASVALRRVAYRAHADEQLDINTCRVDMLKLPDAAEEALMEAADAHLIVFAGGFVQRLTPWLQAWLERWAVCRQVREVALAITGNENAGAPPELAAPELFQFAQKHGLNFIFNYSVVNELGPALFMNHLKEYRLP